MKPTARPTPPSIRTGRRRRLTFRLCGETYSVDVHERVEMVDLATRQRIDPSKWSRGTNMVAVPLGCTPAYFEMRDDTMERLRDYRGLVKASQL